VSAASQMSVINALAKKLLDMLAKAERVDDILREIDNIENQFDQLVQSSAPERITDERFSAAVNAIQDVSEKAGELRRLVVENRFKLARDKVLELQKSIRHAYRLLVLVGAGAPTPVIFQVSPQFLKGVELRPPEELALSSPLAAQLYNTVVRRGRIAVDELAAELKVTDETRDEFNEALALLIQRGFLRPVIGPDNRMLFEAVR